MPIAAKMSVPTPIGPLAPALVCTPERIFSISPVNFGEVCAAIKCTNCGSFNRARCEN